MTGIIGGRTPGLDQTAAEAPELEFEIVGIYQPASTSFDVNTVYTSNAVIYALTDRGEVDETSASIVYVLSHPDHVNDFITDSRPHLPSDHHVLYANDEAYSALTRPLELLSVIASILITVVFIAGAAIILSIVTIFARDRKFEIGLLLSSGEGRLKIVSQFVFEMVLVASLAFMISVGSSYITADYVGTWIVENQLMSQESIIFTPTQGDNALPAIFPRMPNMSTTPLYGEVDMQDIADEFDVSISLSVMGQLLLASLVLVLVGAMVPLIIIMGHKPRRILQEY